MSVAATVVLTSLWTAFLGAFVDRLWVVGSLAIGLLVAAWLFLRVWSRLRFVGFLALVPLAFLAFETYYAATRAHVEADGYKTADRSHYRPGTRIRRPAPVEAAAGSKDYGLNETFIGPDGYRADPVTGAGNPERCRFALIGDSMIYGWGLTYEQTLGPALERLGVPACVFGVHGNGLVDYVRTLEYVAPRLEPGAHIAVYVFAKNDFVGWTPEILVDAAWWEALWRPAMAFEHWRRRTFAHRFIYGPGVRRRPGPAWTLPIGSHPPLRVFTDPGNYAPPAGLTERERQVVEFFFRRLNATATGRPWTTTVVFLPATAEVLAMLAHRTAAPFDRRDGARLEAVRLCRRHGARCEDLTELLYTRTLEAGRNPFFEDDSHFSAFGTGVVAEHYVRLAAQ